MELTADYVFEEITKGLNRALPSLIIAMFMMVIASIEGSDVVKYFAMGCSISFASLSAFLIWGPIDRNRRSLWQNLAIIFFGFGFGLFIITIFAFYFEIIFG